MAEVKVTFRGIEDGVCQLSGKDTEVLDLAFDDGTTRGTLSAKSFMQILRMKLSQDKRKPAAPVATALPAAIPMSAIAK